jgi:arsenate reductase (thioredoxin)
VSRVLFVCVGNTGRSVMAERLLLRASGGRHEARSAGSRPGGAPEPVVLEALAEVGIDATDHVPRRLDDDLIGWADVIVAACDGACPVVRSKRYENWDLPDPKGRPIGAVRSIRTEVERRVKELLTSL